MLLNRRLLYMHKDMDEVVAEVREANFSKNRNAPDESCEGMRLVATRSS